VTGEARHAAASRGDSRARPPGLLWSSSARWARSTKAERAPELALLSALCHGKNEWELVGVAVASIARLDEARAAACFDLLRYHLGEALDRALEAIMATSEHKYLSDFARKYYGEGRAEGEALGKAEGEAQGKVELARAVHAATLTEVFAD
jgi:hypothetical protein